MKDRVFRSFDNRLNFHVYQESIGTFPHTDVKREEKYRLLDHGSCVSFTYRARCFGGFRFANGRFRFIVLTVNDRPHGHGGRSGPHARINGVDWTTPVATIHLPSLHRSRMPTTSVSCVVMHVGKSREILIAVRCHFASEIEGGHLDPSRRDDIEVSSWLCETILCPSPCWLFCLAFYKETRKFQDATRFYIHRKNYWETRFLPNYNVTFRDSD